MQSLASDIQAMLIQAQSGAASAGSASTAATSVPGGATATLTPEQKVAADIQTLIGDFQSAAPPNAQTANSNPTAPVGQTEHHHHHHGHGGEASGATAVAGASGTGAPAANSSTSSNQAVSQVFAADITQALQAYAGASSAMPTPA
jgi:hypothetical protein